MHLQHVEESTNQPPPPKCHLNTTQLLRHVGKSCRRRCCVCDLSVNILLPDIGKQSRSTDLAESVVSKKWFLCTIFRYFFQQSVVLPLDFNKTVKNHSRLHSAAGNNEAGSGKLRTRRESQRVAKARSALTNVLTVSKKIQETNKSLLVTMIHKKVVEVNLKTYKPGLSLHSEITRRRGFVGCKFLNISKRKERADTTTQILAVKETTEKWNMIKYLHDHRKDNPASNELCSGDRRDRVRKVKSSDRVSCPCCS